MSVKKIIRTTIIMLIAALVLFYIMMPPINLSSPAFYGYLFFLVIVFIMNILVPEKEWFKGGKMSFASFKIVKWVGIICGVVATLIVIINVFVSPFFDSKSYASRITINEDADFNKDVQPVDFSKIPLLDKDSSQKLGDRVMGQIPELVSQFYVSDLYTQINYNDQIVRVTPLEYNGFIKYLTNRNLGTAGYITVDSVNGESKLVKLEKGMKYMPSAYFFENLYRKLRFSHPTSIFGEVSFEIDNEGNPYWIVPTIKYAGIGKRKDIGGLIILNAITGESKKYDVKDVPSWVDHVYSANLIIEQVDDWGQYRNGFFNSIFGQKNVVATTDGYNYTTMKDDVYLYTGITSVLADESNIGFVLTNMRTKETSFYAVPGAEEYSAMASAKGQVQQMNYSATFPLLINLNNKPTYLVSLKDNAGLVKMYGFVDVADYQKVVVTDSSKGIQEASRNYLSNVSTATGELKELEITVKSITSSIINGNTNYYIIDTNNNKYRVSINKDEYNLPFIMAGSSLKIKVIPNDKVIDILEIVK